MAKIFYNIRIPALVVTTFVTSLWSVVILDLTTHAYMVPALLLGIGAYSLCMIILHHNLSSIHFCMPLIFIPISNLLFISFK